MSNCLTKLWQIAVKTLNSFQQWLCRKYKAISCLYIWHKRAGLHICPITDTILRDNLCSIIYISLFPNSLEFIIDCKTSDCEVFFYFKPSAEFTSL